MSYSYITKLSICKLQSVENCINKSLPFWKNSVYASGRLSSLREAVPEKNARPTKLTDVKGKPQQQLGPELCCVRLTTVLCESTTYSLQYCGRRWESHFTCVRYRQSLAGKQLFESLKKSTHFGVNNSLS